MSRTKIHVAFLLDETGSMGASKDSTISGFNEYIKGLREDPNGKYRFTLVKFNSDKTEVVHDGVKLRDVQELTYDNYCSCATTPLYDAIARLIHETRPKDKWSVLFIIMTDGEENASVEWDRKGVFDLIEKKKAADWNFIFLGANQDSYLIGDSLGISIGNTANYTQGDEAGVLLSVARSTMCYASSGGGVVTDFMVSVEDSSEKDKQ